MKNILILLLVLSSVFACVSKKSADRLAKDNDSLAMVVAAKDSLINDVFLSINLISENLEAIKMRENIVTANTTGDISKEERVQINEDIAAIGDLLAQNRETIERLKSSTEKLRAANVKIQELEHLVQTLTRRLADKDADIAAMKEELVKMHVEVDELNAAVGNLHTNANRLNENNSKLESVVSSQTDALNTVYYIVGTEKELINRGIIVKSGFIGRTLKVNNDYDMAKLTKADKRTLEKILVGRKKITVVTIHPETSYELRMNDGSTTESLIITDPDKFWESSKVLVISYK